MIAKVEFDDDEIGAKIRKLMETVIPKGLSESTSTP